MHVDFDWNWKEALVVHVVDPTSLEPVEYSRYF